MLILAAIAVAASLRCAVGAVGLQSSISTVSAGTSVKTYTGQCMPGIAAQGPVFVGESNSVVPLVYSFSKCLPVSRDFNGLSK